MPRRIRFGSVTGDALQSLDAQVGTGNENGNNPDNDLVARDSNGNIVLRYDESVGDWVFDSITTGDASVTDVFSYTGGLRDDPESNPWRDQDSETTGMTLSSVSSSFTMGGDNTSQRLSGGVGVGRYHISGRKESDGARFGAFVVGELAGENDFSVLYQSKDSSVGALTFSHEASRLALAIDDAGETYNVTVDFTGAT